MKIHFVKAGETLFEIGQKYGVTVEEIVAVNKSIIDPNLIMAGMKLIIPMKQTQLPVQTPMQAQIHAPVQTPMETPVQAPVQAPVQTQINAPEPMQTPMQTPMQMPMQMPVAADTVAPSIPHYPVNQNMPIQNMLAQNMPVNHNPPTHQYSSQLPVYPGQAVPPFAAFPVPAQQVTAPVTMSTIPAWSMPTEYTAYNTPYHMTNYTMPNSHPNSHLNSHLNSHPNPTPNFAYQGMPQANTNYQPYATNMMQYPSSENYEYYNTYSALQNNSAWSSPNPQPHAQMYQPQLTQDMNEPQASMQQESNEEISIQQEKKKARTSANSSTLSSSKGNGSIRTKRNTLHDQVMRLQQTRSRR